MTEKTSQESPFPPPSDDSESGWDTTSVPSNPDVFMHDVLEDLGFRYDAAEPRLGHIKPYAHGGTGEIFTALDDTLGRTVAVKTLRPKHQYSIDQIERLVREAKAAAQLEHPNIVPIHSMGVSPSRGVYFTMKRLRGDSLRRIVNQLSLRNPAYTRVYTRTELMLIFMKICQGISYAHSKGIIHRDLKPENILVGNYGEVTIIDWGLVKKMDMSGSPHVPGRRRDSRPPDSGVAASSAWGGLGGEEKLADAMQKNSVSLPPGNITQNGQLNGTPRFMSPEQINGDVEDIDSRSDIYALGIILYELLTFRNPFGELAEENEIFDAVRRGLYQRPRRTERGYSISPELEAICLKAMAVDKENRYQAVGELIKDLTAHQEGLPVSCYRAPVHVRVAKLCKRNPIKASAILSCVVAILMYLMVSSFLDSLYFRRTMRQVQVSVATGELKLEKLDKRLVRDAEAMQAMPTGEEGDFLSKEHYDELRDEIDGHFSEANLLLSSVAGLHHGAQSEIQNWRERIMTAQIEFCLKHGKINEMRKLRAILSAAMGGDLDAYSYKMRMLIRDMETALLGVCHLQIESDPPGADVMISFMEQTEDGTIVAGASVFDEPLYTPVYNIAFGKGTYMVTMRLDGAPDLSFPVTLRHGENKQLTVSIPREVPEGMVYIPGGTCLVGGAQSPYKRTYETDLEPYYISRHEVTNREYIAFWLTLQDTKLLNAYMSRVLLSRGSNLPKNAWSRSGKPIAEIDLDKPVVGIPREAAQAYCVWYGRRLGRPCRLPTAEEWEKAARGTDGRLYPWGNIFVKDFAFTYENAKARWEFGLWAKPESFPKDVSPYGVYDMAGNVREWTSSDFPESNGVFPQIKGASASTTSRYLPLECSDDTAVVPSDVGFRIVMPYLPTDTVGEEQ